MICCIISLWFSGCGENKEGNEEDKAIAIECAEEKALKYYESHLDGKCFGSGEFAGCEISNSSARYSDGKYIVTVNLKIKGVSNDKFKAEVSVDDKIEYTIEVNDGTASVIDTNYFID